jgi:CBS-domain-containing membrane protein
MRLFRFLNQMEIGCNCYLTLWQINVTLSVDKQFSHHKEKLQLIKPLLRISWSLIGAASAMLIALWLIAPPVSPFLLASLGGSAVFLFALTNAPAAQPRALLGSHLGGALIGVVCYQLFDDGLWVYALAQVITLLFMLIAHTMQPPAGSNPLIMIEAHGDFSMILDTVLIGVLCLFIVVWIWSRVFNDSHSYPIKWWQRSPPQRLSGVWKDEC